MKKNEPIQTSPVTFPGESRFHLGLQVADLDASIQFYQQVFDLEPTKVKPGYAKFESLDPSINFTLNQGRKPSLEQSGLSHLGIQLKDTGQLARARQRLQDEGLVKHSEERTSCCFAVQDKFWLEDPDGNALEFFVVLEKDAPEAVTPEPAQACCTGTGVEAPASSAQTCCTG